jgi:hypothetical protein
MTSNTSDWDRLHRSLPNAPHVDVQEVRGNVPDADKQIVANVLAYICTGSGITRISSPFANDISGRLKIVGLNLRGDESEAILEIKVTESNARFPQLIAWSLILFSSRHVQCVWGDARWLRGLPSRFVTIIPSLVLNELTTFCERPTLVAMVLLGRAKGFDGSGVSQSMNVYWHHPAPLYVPCCMF